MKDDPVILNSLIPRHITAARFSEASQIFYALNSSGGNKWYKIKERNDLIEGYLTELGSLLEQLMLRWQEATRVESLSAIIISTLLIRSSLRAHAELYSADVYKFLVERQLMTPAKAFALAGLVNEQGRRADILQKIRFNLPGPLASDSDSIIFDSAAKVHSSDDRVLRLATLAAQSPSSQADTYIAEIAKEPNEGSKSGAFERMAAAGIPAYQLEMLIDHAKAFVDKNLRNRCLIRLIPYLSEARQEALKSILLSESTTGQNSPDQLRRLEELIPLLSISQFEELAWRLPFKMFESTTHSLYPVLRQRLAQIMPAESSYQYFKRLPIEGSQGWYLRDAVKLVVVELVKTDYGNQAMDLVRLHLQEGDLEALIEPLRHNQEMLTQLWNYACEFITSQSGRKRFAVSLARHWTVAGERDLYDLYKFYDPEGTPQEESLFIVSRLCLAGDFTYSSFARKKLLQYLDENIEKEWAVGYMPAFAAACEWFDDSDFNFYADRVFSKDLPWFSNQRPSLLTLAEQLRKRNMMERLPRLFWIIPDRGERFEFLAGIGQLLQNYQVSNFLHENSCIQDTEQTALTILFCRVLSGRHSGFESLLQQINYSDCNVFNFDVIKGLLPKTASESRQQLLSWAVRHTIGLRDSSKVARCLAELSPYVDEAFFEEHFDWRADAEDLYVKLWLLKLDSFAEKRECAETLYQEIVNGEWEGLHAVETLLFLTTLLPELEERLWEDLQTGAIFSEIRTVLLAKWFPALAPERRALLTQSLIQDNRLFLDLDDDSRISCLSYLLPYIDAVPRREVLRQEFERIFMLPGEVDLHLRLHALKVFGEYKREDRALLGAVDMQLELISSELNTCENSDGLYFRIELLGLLMPEAKTELKDEISELVEQQEDELDLEEICYLLFKAGERLLINRIFERMRNNRYQRISDIIPFLVKEDLLWFLDEGQIPLDNLANVVAVARNLLDNQERGRAAELILGLGHRNPRVFSSDDWKEVKMLFKQLLPEIIMPLSEQIGGMTEVSSQLDFYLWLYPHLAPEEKTMHILPLIDLLLSETTFYRYKELSEVLAASAGELSDFLIRQIIHKVFVHCQQMRRQDFLMTLNAILPTLRDLEPEALSSFEPAIAANIEWWP